MNCYDNHGRFLIFSGEIWKSDSCVRNQFFINLVNLVAKLTGVHNHHNLYLIWRKFFINPHKSCKCECSCLTRTSWSLDDQIIERCTSCQWNSGGLNFRWLQKAHLLQVDSELLRHIEIFIIPILSLRNKRRWLIVTLLQNGDFSDFTCISLL